MNKSAPGSSQAQDSKDPRDPSEAAHAPVFPEGSRHPSPPAGAPGSADSPAQGLPPDHTENPNPEARGAQGRYGLSEEPAENADPVPHVPKSVDQLARDRDRDEAVRETGEDLN